MISDDNTVHALNSLDIVKLCSKQPGWHAVDDRTLITTKRLDLDSWPKTWDLTWTRDQRLETCLGLAKKRREHLCLLGSSNSAANSHWLGCHLLTSSVHSFDHALFSPPSYTNLFIYSLFNISTVRTMRAWLLVTFAALTLAFSSNLSGFISPTAACGGQSD